MADVSGLDQQKPGVQKVSLVATNKRHFVSDQGAVANAEILYRQPMQPSLDGNTVDSQLEHSAFAKNAIGYMTTLQFMTGRIQGLMKAIRGQ